MLSRENFGSYTRSHYQANKMSKNIIKFSLSQFHKCREHLFSREKLH